MRVQIFIGGGDFNARMGELGDFKVDIDVINSRQRIDLQRNKHGDAFIALVGMHVFHIDSILLGSKLCVLNCRVQG